MLRRRPAPLPLLALASCLAGTACDLFTDPVPPPSAPPSLSAEVLSDDVVELAWAPAAGEVEHYLVERASAGAAFDSVAVVADTVTRVLDAGLEPTTAYVWRVSGCNESGCSPPSPVAAATTLATLVAEAGELPDAVEDAPYSVTLVAEGGLPPYTWSRPGNVPPGLELSGNGTLAGAPRAPGTYIFPVRVASADGQVDTALVALEVVARLEVTTSSLPDAVLGAPYTAGLSATGGRFPYVWALTAGSLPAGLSLSDDGILSGTPDTEQTATFTVEVRGAAGQVAARAFTITVFAPGAEPVAIRTSVLPPGLEGSPYEPLLVAAGGVGEVAWSVVGGALPPGVTLAPGGGLSGVPLATGTFTFTVRATSGGSQDERTFHVRVVPHRTDRYDLTRMDAVTVPGTIEPHVEAAFARWEQVLAGDLSPGQIPRGFFSSSFCGGFGDALNGTSVDDAIVVVNIAPIDGAGGVLGRAGPCGIRDGTRLPFVGALTLDADDLAPLVGTQKLTDIVFHEIGHILGIGTLWRSLDLVAGSGTVDPTFTGGGAIAEYAALGRAGNVPLEDTGGPGTAESHWRESVFGDEVMTGFSEAVGVRMPLSRLTIASLADVGYLVDLGAADPFELPEPAAAPAPGRGGEPERDVAGIGPVRTLPRGPGGDGP